MKITENSYIFSQLIIKNIVSIFFCLKADNWPMVFDDSNARKDWNWQPKYDLSGLVKKMLDELRKTKAIKA